MCMTWLWLRRLMQHLIALAGHCFQRFEIENFNGASRITDSAAGLDSPGDFRHRRAANTEHLRQEFLRELDRIALGPHTALQQPATKARFHAMQRVAGGGDPGLFEQDLIVMDTKVGNGLARLCGLSQLRRWNPASESR